MTVVWVLLALVLPAVVLVILVLAAGAVFTQWIAGKVRRGFQPTGRFLQTSAGRVHVVERGSGPPVILIHGLGGQIGNFNYGVIDRLADRYRVIAIDRLGSGFSDPMPTGFTGIRRHALVVAEVIEALVGEPSLIVGHSLGGAVALAVAIDHPERTKALCLVAPLTAIQDDPPAAFRALKLRYPWQRRLIGATLAIPLSLTRTKATLEALFGPEQAPADFPTRALGVLSLRPEAFIAASTDLVHANDDLPWLIGRYREIIIPISILCARQDRILDAGMHGRGLADAVPQTKLTLINGGHMIPVTAPEAVAAFIDKAAQEVFRA